MIPFVFMKLNKFLSIRSQQIIAGTINIRKAINSNFAIMQGSGMINLISFILKGFCAVVLTN